MIAIGSGVRVGEPICTAGGRSADDGSEGEGEMIMFSNDPEEAEQQKKSLVARDNELRPVSTCNSFDSHNSIAIGRYVRYKKNKTAVNPPSICFVLSLFSLSLSTPVHFLQSYLTCTHLSPPLPTVVWPPKRPSVSVLRLVAIGIFIYIYISYKFVHKCLI